MTESYTSIFVLGGAIAVAIILMSVFFIVKAVRRAKQIGMDKKIVKDTIRSSAVFSVVPSIPIVIGIGILMQSLGIAIPWIRLTVIGALQYELIAMNQAQSALGAEASPEVFVATATVIMTLSIISGPLFNAIFYKKYQNKLASLQEKNGKLMNTVTGALLGGLLAGMLSSILVGGIFSIGNPVTDNTGVTTYGQITIITLVSGMIIMALCGVILKVFKQKWIESYALPVTILGALAIAYAFTASGVFA